MSNSQQSYDYHSIIFELDNGTKYNTWDSWRLLPESRPIITPAKPKKNTVEIPGSNGIIDISTALTGYPLYENRTGPFDFFVMHEDYRESFDGYDWSILYHDIMSAIHGKHCKIYLLDDENYYYDGYCTFGNWTSNNDGKGSTLSIDYDVHPFKMSVNQTTIAENVSTYVDISVEGDMPVTPIIKIENSGQTAFTAKYYINNTEVTKELTNGEHTYDDIVLSSLVNGGKIRFTGSGKVTMTYRKGYL